MDAKMTINFKRQKDGSTLATVVLIVSGSSQPQFHRMVLAPGVDPWSVYSDIAGKAVGYLQANQKKGSVKEKPNGARKSPTGKLIQLRAVLPLG